MSGVSLSVEIWALRQIQYDSTCVNNYYVVHCCNLYPRCNGYRNLTNARGRGHRRAAHEVRCAARALIEAQQLVSDAAEPDASDAVLDAVCDAVTSRLRTMIDVCREGARAAGSALGAAQAAAGGGRGVCDRVQGSGRRPSGADRRLARRRVIADVVRATVPRRAASTTTVLYDGCGRAERVWGAGWNKSRCEL